MPCFKISMNFWWPNSAKYKSWTDLAKDIDDGTHCGFSAFFEPDQSYFDAKRTAGVSRVRTKCMVKPDLIFEMGIHHISKQNIEEMTPENKEPDVALLHHYRVIWCDFVSACQPTTIARQRVSSADSGAASRAVSSRVAPDTGLVELKGFAENWRPGAPLWQILHHLRRLLARVEVSCSSTEPADIDEAVAKGQFANPEAASVRHRLESDAAASLQPATDGSGAVDIDCAGGIGELDPSARLWQLAAAENALTDEGDEFLELRSAMFEEAGSRELADAWSVGLWHLGRRPLPECPAGWIRDLCGF
uniref:Aha1_N domain-containing protein n=1 Tax=Macrostomum lignano TaxID=282301 RepID=A0A1I8FQS8_9PLAT